MKIYVGGRQIGKTHSAFNDAFNVAKVGGKVLIISRHLNIATDFKNKMIKQSSGVIANNIVASNDIRDMFSKGFNHVFIDDIDLILPEVLKSASITLSGLGCTTLKKYGEKQECCGDCAETKPTKNLKFGQAVEAIKEGKKIAREGWNGRGMFVYYVAGGKYKVQSECIKGKFEDDLVPYNPYMAIKNVNNTISTWVPSVNDVLAEDWLIVE